VYEPSYSAGTDGYSAESKNDAYSAEANIYSAHSSMYNAHACTSTEKEFFSMDEDAPARTSSNGQNPDSDKTMQTQSESDVAPPADQSKKPAACVRLALDTQTCQRAGLGIHNLNRASLPAHSSKTTPIHDTAVAMTTMSARAHQHGGAYNKSGIGSGICVLLIESKISEGFVGDSVLGGDAVLDTLCDLRIPCEIQRFGGSRTSSRYVCVCAHVCINMFYACVCTCVTCACLVRYIDLEGRDLQRKKCMFTCKTYSYMHTHKHIHENTHATGGKSSTSRPCQTC
jgi:hypothetical protein